MVLLSNRVKPTHVSQSQNANRYHSSLHKTRMSNDFSSQAELVIRLPPGEGGRAILNDNKEVTWRVYIVLTSTRAHIVFSRS